MAQGHGSAAVANVGPPEAALFPDLAALQDRLEEQGWMLRGQATFILQGHPRFSSPYCGAGRLSPAPNARNTLSTDLVLGRQLWRWAEVIVDASVTRGFGPSSIPTRASPPASADARLPADRQPGLQRRSRAGERHLAADARCLLTPRVGDG
jgi:high affinity Mn2+ porin